MNILPTAIYIFNVTLRSQNTQNILYEIRKKNPKIDMEPVMVLNSQQSLEWKNITDLGMVAHIFNSQTWEAEVGKSLNLGPTWSTE